MTLAFCHSRASPVYRATAGAAMSRHGAGGDVDRIRRRQQGPVGLRFQVAVGALDVAVGEGVTGGSIQAHAPAGGGHAAIDHPRRTVQHQHLVGGSVNRTVAPGFALAIHVCHVSLLHDRIDAAAGVEGRIKRVAGADAVGLARSLGHDAGVRRAVDRSQLSQSHRSAPGTFPP